MKAKLIKTEVNYILEDVKGVVIASTSLKKEGLSLSLKNCQAIERGYDLDELAENYGIENGLDLGCFDEVKNSKTDFKAGFQKALELMGDKKFSEYDMTSIFEYGWNQRHYEIMDEAELEGIKNRYIQSLQQTEWDVEIEMKDVFIKNSDQYVDEVSVGNYSTHSKSPRLDTDGCLILKTFKTE